jgi:hypothetical protein
MFDSRRNVPVAHPCLYRRQDNAIHDAFRAEGASQIMNAQVIQTSQRYRRHKRKMKVLEWPAVLIAKHILTTSRQGFEDGQRLFVQVSIYRDRLDLAL